MIERLSQAVNAVSKFAAKKDVRYYLNGVALYIENGKVNVMVATDGHCMALVGDERAVKGFPVIVGNADVSTLATAFVTDSSVIVGDDTITIGKYTIPLVDGRFPDARRVIPEKERTAGNEIGIQPNYLAKLKPFKAELVRHLSAKDKNFVGTTMRCGGANDTVRFDFTNPKIDQAVVLINPMRL